MELLLFFVGIALAVSFFCSLAEATLLSVTPSYIEAEKKRRPATAARLERLKGEVEKPLATILTWNTLANTLGATGAGAQYAGIFGAETAVLFALGLTVAILVFSEIIPKTLGATYWKKLAGPVALVLAFFVRISWLFVIFAQAITRHIGKRASEPGVSRDELLAMTALGSRSGALEPAESRIFSNLLRFRSGKVSDIMTPRTVVYMLPATMTVEAFVAEAMGTSFTRIPIYGKNRDDITAFVLKGDVLMSRVRGENQRPLSDFARPIEAIPATASIYHLFNSLIEKKQHLMLVVDEYGGMEGVVTLEDVVETLLGLEIVDEADRAADLQQLARRLWQQRARQMNIDPPAKSKADG